MKFYCDGILLGFKYCGEKKVYVSWPCTIKLVCIIKEKFNTWPIRIGIDHFLLTLVVCNIFVLSSDATQIAEC